MATIGAIKARLLIQVGDGDPHEIGKAEVPLTATLVDRRTVDVSFGGPGLRESLAAEVEKVAAKLRED